MAGWPPASRWSGCSPATWRSTLAAPHPPTSTRWSGHSGCWSRWSRSSRRTPRVSGPSPSIPRSSGMHQSLGLARQDRRGGALRQTATIDAADRRRPQRGNRTGTGVQPPPARRTCRDTTSLGSEQRQESRCCHGPIGPRQLASQEGGELATTPAEAQHTVAKDGNGRNGVETNDDASDVVELDLRDPQFMTNAFETYAELREKGPVVRVKFGSGEATEENQRNPFFQRETYFVSHYDDVVATLLDDRFSVDLLSQMSPEAHEHQLEGAEEFRPLARSLISIDPPDHTRIRKLVQPSFTGRGMEAMRGSIQEVVDRLLDGVERDAEARGETAP